MCKQNASLILQEPSDCEKPGCEIVRAPKTPGAIENSPSNVVQHSSFPEHHLTSPPERSERRRRLRRLSKWTKAQVKTDETFLTQFERHRLKRMLMALDMESSHADPAFCLGSGFTVSSPRSNISNGCSLHSARYLS